MKPTNLFPRRSAVTLGVILSIVLGAFTIRAAAAWTASSAPLPPPALSASAIAAQLQAERARSAALQQQLDALIARSGQLDTALSAAQGRIATDATTADQLRTALAAAQARIAAADRQLAALNAAGLGGGSPAAPGGGAPAATAPPATGGEPGDD